MKDLTIIITTYNSEKFINNLLCYLDDFKIAANILFADDNSKDGTIDEIKKWKNNNNESFLKISIHKTKMNIGLGKNRQISVSTIKTKYILFADVDDFIDLKELNNVYQQIGNNKIVITKRIIVNDKKLINVNNFNCKTYFRYSFWAIWGIIFDLETFKQIDFLDNCDVGEDINSFTLLSNNKFKIIKTKNPVYYHIRYDYSMTGRLIKKERKYYESFYQNLEKFYKESNHPHKDKILKFVLIKSINNVKNLLGNYQQFVFEQKLNKNLFYFLFFKMITKNKFIKLFYILVIPDILLNCIYSVFNKPIFDKKQLRKILMITSCY